MARQGPTLKEVAENIGVAPKWIRRQIKKGAITPKRRGSNRNGRFVFSDADVTTLRSILSSDAVTGDKGTALARIAQLESDRADLLAQVAWTRAIAQEQQKAVEAEQRRTERLEAELQTQRARIEQLKALSLLDRILGRHKSI